MTLAKIISGLTPFRIIAGLVALVVFIGVIVLSLNWFQARGYDKARREYEANDKVEAEQSAKLKAHAEFLEARVAELEPKLAAYEKLADDKKRLDESITTKIDQVVAEGLKEDAETNAVTDCWTRSQRTCDKFHRMKPPIDLDCEAYKRKICS